jgi:hypothetical protein
VPLFAPGSGALYCPQGENNSTGCQLMSNGVDNVLRHAGSNLQQKVKFDCYKHIMVRGWGRCWLTGHFWDRMKTRVGSGFL